MPRESFPPISKNEQRTDPVLDRLHAEMAELERAAEFKRLALLAKKERLEAELKKQEEDEKYYFGQKEGWQEKRSKKAKIAGVVGTAALTLSSIKMGEEELEKKKELPAKIAAAPKPSKHASKMTHGVSRHVSDALSPLGPKTLAVNPSEPSAAHEVAIPEIATPHFETQAPEGAVPRHGDTIAPVAPLRAREIPVAVSETEAPGLAAAPEPRVKDVAAIDKLDTAPLKHIETGSSLQTPLEKVSVPAFESSRAQDSVSQIRPAGLKQFEAKAAGSGKLSERKIPKLPPVVADTASASRTSQYSAFPAGTVLPKEGESVDTAEFDFDEIGNPAAPAPKAPSKEKKEETLPSGKKSKIQVSNFDDKGRPEIPVVPVTRRDSVFYTHSLEIGDTSGRPKVEVTIEPGAEKFLRPQADSVEKILLPDGTYMAKMRLANEGFKLGEHQEITIPDLKKVKIAGGFTVPEILKYRIGDTAWKKLEEYGLLAQYKYLQHVESKENTGPWTMAVKAKGAYMIFDADNELKAEIPFLFGASKGDSLNTYTTSKNKEGKTTPAGDYILKPGATHGEFGHGTEAWAMVTVLPDGTLLNQGLALHGEIAADKKGQEKDIHSATGEDNHETIGCIRVDDEGMKIIRKYLKGRDHYLQYILSEDPSVSYDDSTGKLEKLTDKQIRQRISDGIKKFWQENPILYYLTKESVREKKDGSGEKTSTYYRDPKADQKIVYREKGREKIEIPLFIQHN